MTTPKITAHTTWGCSECCWSFSTEQKAFDYALSTNNYENKITDKYQGPGIYVMQEDRSTYHPISLVLLSEELITQIKKELQLEAESNYADKRKQLDNVQAGKSVYE